ncbi:response regulator transcription factor [Marinomonas sp. 15G1-11]|uniref:Response regulator transcription factor n=1 Tax=Marinomonas phaeophyticola TaxID=3004091 RepID=A0ABT4JTF7_9GAMM|nr:response regulator transcription factor [Marinomonas sp. 15G1-11]MCZ2721642.1 response regulator transcription factor [Marinomonas sp. 15G1-11]
MTQKLLIIDDDAVLISTLKRAMERRGLSVTTATNGKEAIKRLQETEQDFATLDLKLEKESGLTILEQILAVQPNLKVVVLTGYASIPSTVEAIKRGAQDYLCKPASGDDIFAALTGSKVATVEIAEKPLSVDRVEWEHIQRVMSENDGNISATARALGMHRRTLQRKLQKHPLDNV